MAKGSRINDAIGLLITKTFSRMYKQDPKVTAKEVRAEVNTILRQRNPKLGPDWPGVSAVGKVITKIKKKMTEIEPDPADIPWSIDSLAKYDIPPEALPVVLQAWAKALLDDKPLTIRQVKWIARLYYLLRDKGTEFLTEQAITWAEQEKINKLYGERNYTLHNMWFDWIKDAILYSMITDDDSLLTKCFDSLNWSDTTLTKLQMAIEDSLVKQQKEAQHERTHSQEV